MCDRMCVADYTTKETSSAHQGSIPRPGAASWGRPPRSRILRGAREFVQLLGQTIARRAEQDKAQGGPRRGACGHSRAFLLEYAGGPGALWVAGGRVALSLGPRKVTKQGRVSPPPPTGTRYMPGSLNQPSRGGPNGPRPSRIAGGVPLAGLFASEKLRSPSVNFRAVSRGGGRWCGRQRVVSWLNVSAGR